MKHPAFSQKHISQFKKMGIDAIYLFGSHATGFVTPLSDVDIGVVFSNPEKYKDHTLDAYSILYGIFSDIYAGSGAKGIDVVFLQFTPLSLQFNAIKEGQLLYKKSDAALFQYREEVMRRYPDLKHFYELSCRYILERI